MQELCCLPDLRQGFAQVFRRSGTAQGYIGFAANGGDRGAQFMIGFGQKEPASGFDCCKGGMVMLEADELISPLQDCRQDAQRKSGNDRGQHNTKRIPRSSIRHQYRRDQPCGTQQEDQRSSPDDAAAFHATS